MLALNGFVRPRQCLILMRAGEWRSPTEEWTHYGDVHVFDARSGTWSEWTPATAPTPSARRGHAAAYVASIRSVFVFGGTCGDTQNEQCMRDSWAYQVLSVTSSHDAGFPAGGHG